MKVALENIGSTEILKLSKTFGLIAEDNSDIEVLKEIFAKFFEQSEFSTKKFVGNGCGKLRNKCGVWSENLFRRGCDYVFVFHDLDRNDYSELKRSLESKVCPKAHPNSLIVIPVEELESWLLSDAAAIQKVFRLSTEPKVRNNVEAIESPKEYLGSLIWRSGKKKYLNTVHNKKIASATNIESLRKCKSFMRFSDYIESVVCA